MPLVVIHSDIKTLVTVNGSTLGEAGPDCYVSLPVSPRGNIYVCIMPLENEQGRKYYPVTRRFSFEAGQLVPPICDDVRVTEWPLGVFEFQLQAGEFPETVSSIACALKKINLPGGRKATLYRDNGLHVAIERGDELLFTYTHKSDGVASLEQIAVNRLLTIAKGPECHAAIIDCNSYRTLYEGSGAFYEFGGQELTRISPLGTFKRHERQDRISIDGELISSTVGHFIEPPRTAQTEQETAVCFAQAVLHDLPEATSYLGGDLASLTLDQLKSFFGEFTVVAAPPCAISDNTLIGLLGKERLQKARIFSLRIENRSGNFAILDIHEL